MECMGVYVDDIILAAKTDEKLKSSLAEKFDIKDLGKLRYFLGISVIQDDDCKSVWMGQPIYTENLLTKFNMHNCKPVSTPAEPGTKLKWQVKPMNVWTNRCISQQLEV